MDCCRPLAIGPAASEFGRASAVQTGGVRARSGLPPSPFMLAVNMSLAIGELIHLNKIIIQQGDEDEIVLYWYMWGKGVPRDRENSIMLRISTPIIFSENESLDILKNFGNELFPEMYKPKTRSSIMGIQLIERFGVFGFILEALILAFPFFIILRYRKS